MGQQLSLLAENHRVLEAVARYVARWGVKVDHFNEQGKIASARVTFGNLADAEEAWSSFNGIPGPVTVVADLVGTSKRMLFTWESRRG